MKKIRTIDITTVELGFTYPLTLRYDVLTTLGRTISATKTFPSRDAVLNETWTFEIDYEVGEYADNDKMYYLAGNEWKVPTGVIQSSTGLANVIMSFSGFKLGVK
jgi:hypothetical protein